MQEISDHFNVNFEGEGESRRVMVSGDATRFPRMHLFLQGLGFTRPEDGEEDRYALFCVSVGVDMSVHTIQN